jgi:hypothetical protein
MREMKFNLLYLLTLLFFAASCAPPAPNVQADGKDIIEIYESPSDYHLQAYRDTMYIPAYEQIYSESKQKLIPLSITLSIRSTCYTDTTIINSIKYHDSQGVLIKSYLKKPILLKPMHSIDYVVDVAKNIGNTEVVRVNTGANFIIDWGSHRNTFPVMQCVMNGSVGNHSISFVTNAVSISPSHRPKY